ncbi:MAG: bifunctional phosphopantothenoylcysteine decarboxylase/phosphopantothenate--cysteine ligase CoaBC [Planctomycetes bacterium]|nr:bifunctional phosphopantothenoylcysteine decarboxylase/phosphopantothenate--cysteine ligase CoaBC [Planctomycetota bacterium]
MTAVSPNLATLDGREVLVGVTGGIAAYKTAYLVSALVQAGAEVTVVMTEAAKRFVGPLTFRALTGRPVYDDLWSAPEGDRSTHIALADRVDVAVVAPATANLLAKMAHGLADDLLSTLLVAIDVPVILAPAMNERMWRNAAVQANVAALRARGVHLVGPEEGRLACGTEGPGRMAEPDAILAEIVKALGGEP